MHVISRRTIDQFSKKHSDARAPLEAWYYEATHLEWKSPQDVKDRFPSASFLSGNRVVFKIKGNKYRMLVHIAYKTGTIFIKQIGTHAEYSKWRTEA